MPRLSQVAGSERECGREAAPGGRPQSPRARAGGRGLLGEVVMSQSFIRMRLGTAPNMGRRSPPFSVRTTFPVLWRAREVPERLSGSLKVTQPAGFQDRSETWGGRALGCCGSRRQTACTSTGSPRHGTARRAECEQRPVLAEERDRFGAGTEGTLTGGPKRLPRARSGRTSNAGGEGSWPTGDRLLQQVLTVSLAPSLHLAQRGLPLKRGPACAAPLLRDLQWLPCSPA